MPKFGFCQCSIYRKKTGTLKKVPATINKYEDTYKNLLLLSFMVDFSLKAWELLLREALRD
jgi:hypothetical protein